MNRLPFPLPPLNEQKRIVDKVERFLDRINQAKQLIEEAKETFDLRRAAIFDQAFRGELTTKWREKVQCEGSAKSFLDKIHLKKQNNQMKKAVSKTN
ncbi:restriction endonuclease subunit S [Paenibacillus sp. sgz302251]|uniref:restriction endonuclease subunit S n=1 Tax=Paenibacillus sp. sgz302251 TaxID=3414493 RepID=UPI003C7AED4B